MFLGRNLLQIDFEIQWWFWAGYAATLAQALMFLLYIFIYHNFEARQRGVNLIQMSLVTSTYLISATVVSCTYGTLILKLESDELGLEIGRVLITCYIFWFLCTIFMWHYLCRNFRLAVPDDADPPGTIRANQAATESVSNTNDIGRE